MAKEIPLTQGKVAIVDDEDYEWLSQWKWYVIRSRRTDYAGRWDRHAKVVLMHRVIACPSRGVGVDHADGDGLNNQRSNLRIATREQNMQNRKASRLSKSGFKGVRRCAYHRWRAEIKANHQYYSLGYYDTPEEAAKAYDKAAKAYDKAAKVLHGSFARLNFPE